MRYSVLTCIFLCFSLWGLAQINADTLRIISYNTENFFDCKHDSLKNDTDFLPDGNYHWTQDRFKKKESHIARVINEIGGWNTPALIGLVEVENESCLKSLTQYSPLKNLKYKYIHHESPDLRGIDVALLYQPNKFKPFHNEFISIHFPNNPTIKTRDILYSAGKLRNGDTLHIFVNHFPSRLGGETASEDRRLYVASVLRTKIDSIKRRSPNSNILIMGDFNDYPTNKSMESVLKAQDTELNIEQDKLYNLFYHYQKEGKIGSHKFDGEWGMLDQIIVSGNLLMSNKSISISLNSAQIFAPEYLLEDDARYMGKKPFRTFSGQKYLGGYSDHLPIYIDLIVK